MEMSNFYFNLLDTNIFNRPRYIKELIFYVYKDENVFFFENSRFLIFIVVDFK